MTSTPVYLCVLTYRVQSPDLYGKWIENIHIFLLKIVASSSIAICSLKMISVQIIFSKIISFLLTRLTFCSFKSSSRRNTFNYWMWLYKRKSFISTKWLGKIFENNFPTIKLIFILINSFFHNHHLYQWRKNKFIAFYLCISMYTIINKTYTNHPMFFIFKQYS